MVAPLAGAWIEIECQSEFFGQLRVAPLAGAWIEIIPWKYDIKANKWSLPSRERGLK